MILTAGSMAFSTLQNHLSLDAIAMRPVAIEVILSSANMKSVAFAQIPL